MPLDANQVIKARRRVVAEVLSGAPVAVTKADIDSSVAACVAWIESNQGSAVAALNGTALAGASASIKAAVIAIAIETRYT